MAKTVKRLFRDFQPEHYELTLNPNADDMTFTGSVVITGKKTGRPSQRITLHQKDLKVTRAKLNKLGKDKKTIEIDRINTHNRFDEVRLHSKSMVYPGEYRIELEFSGVITDQMHGLYPCYFEHEGQKKKLLATQFESHHAREVFPCIDEPEAKATFSLALITSQNEVALSNTPIKTQGKKDDKLVTTFEKTPIMSIYLLAFVIGEIHKLTSKTKHGVEVSSWSTVAQPKAHLQYANDEAVKILEFFEDYFKTPFPLPKVDQVALPDFESLAMENWGLITFREVGLLADPNNRSISGEQMISLVIAHEMSHQWFGNLVTMKWWDDLWLNESFASLMEHLALDKLHPDWHEWESFTSSRVISASNRDIYKDVQAVGVGVNHPDEIMTLFDPSIVYAKGARLLKMLFDYIGEEAFREGLKSYFKKYAFKNTVRDDLWAEMSKATKKDISKLMTPWIEQSGTPLLSVIKDSKKIHLSQERFLLDGEDKESLWEIPLLTKPKIDLNVLESRAITINNQDNKSPIFNRTGSGHFITHYLDHATQNELAKGIIDRSLDSSTRIIAINDLLRLSEKGEVSLSELLKLIADCKQEDRDAVWSMFIRAISYAHILTEGNQVATKNLKAYRRRLATYWYDQLGWHDGSNDDPNTKHLRTTALSLSIGGENSDAIQIAIDTYKKAKKAENLPAEQRAIIIGAVTRSGDKIAIKSLMKEYETSISSEVKDSITAGLCSTQDRKVVKQIIDWGMSGSGIIRDQDIDHWYAYLMRNQYSRDQAWEWFTANYDSLSKKFGDGKRMEYFIWYSSRSLSTPEWKKKFEDLFVPKLNNVALVRNIKIALSEIDAQVAWRKRDEPKIKAFLSKF